MNSEISKRDLHTGLNTIVRESLKPTTLGVGILYAVFAVSHALMLPRAIATTMSILAGGTALTLLVLRYRLGRRTIPPRWAHPVGAGIAGLVLLNSLLHLYLTDEPQQTTNLMLLIVGLGSLLLSTRWFALTLAATLIGWGVIVALSTPSPSWLHYGFALLTATVLSIIAHSVRSRTLRRLEKTGLSEQIQKSKLTKALQAVQWSERRLWTLFESASEGIALVKDDGNIALVNTSIEEMFGYSREELLNHPIGQLIPEKLQAAHTEHCAGYFRDPHTRPMGTGLELSGRRKDGSTFPVDISLSFIRTADETLALAFVADVTQRKQAEKALQEYSERLAEMVEERTQELREAQTQLLAQQRLQQEIELAAQIQASLLPRQVPSLPGFEFAARALPAHFVSGDLYDFVPLSQETHLIVLADIAGKGVPAALLTSTARALLHAEADHDDSPAAILSSINASLCDDLSHAQMFITFLVACLDTRSGILTYANAGHNEILWARQIERTCHPLQATGVPIGIFKNIDITEETIALLPGDALIFYSDGITEAENAREEFFGLKRLIDIVSLNADLPAEELCHIIVEAVETFRTGAPRSDDLTLVILKALPRTIPFDNPATLEHLNDVTALVRQATSVYGDDFAYQVELATSEIATNIIQHAYQHTPGELRGQITLFPDRVELDLYDDGMPFDPSALPAPELGKLQEGGYGLFIAKEMVSELIYTPASPDGNHWHLIKLARKETGRRNEFDD